MTKQEREKIRIEVAKKYKEEIQELRSENRKFSDYILELTEENRRLKMELNKKEMGSIKGNSDMMDKLINMSNIYKILNS